VSTFTSYWLAPVAAVRPWLLLRALLLLFAFDLWSDHLGPAWRYGTAAFNVAHFAILDTLPIPSTGAYVGTLIFLGVAAFVCAVVSHAPRPLLALLALGYAWSWMCSMHDGYQHHYFLSWVLVAFVFFPVLSSADLWGSPRAIPWHAAGTPGSSRKAAAKKRDHNRAAHTPPHGLPHGLVPGVSAFAYVLVTATCAVVYAYTAWSKTEAEWLSGVALRTITHDGRSIAAVVALARPLGLESERFWWWMGHSVVAVQLVIALGYATAPVRDRAIGPLRIGLELVAWLALSQALLFHLGAEYIGLEIGWFSWYMLIIGLAALTPASALSVIALALTLPTRAIAEAMGKEHDAGAVVGLAGIAAIALGAVGAYADVPGAMQGAIVAGLLVVGATVFAAGRRRGLRGMRAIAIAAGVASIAMFFALYGSPARYDYWRFAGGDFRRRGDYAAALDAYLHAERWAPAGMSRAPQIDEMRRRLASD